MKRAQVFCGQITLVETGKTLVEKSKTLVATSKIKSSGNNPELFIYQLILFLS